jgi:hypothetical protein
MMPPRRRLRLSPRARLAAERLAEAAGVPVAEMLEMILLDLLDSSAAVEAAAAGPPASAHHHRATPATVISIARGRKPAPPRPASRLERLRERSRVARELSLVVCERGKAAREASARVYQRHESHVRAASVTDSSTSSSSR